jgi:hypothetical protein
LGTGGGSALAEYLEWLRADLDDFFGAVAEVSQGLANERASQKPLALIRYEQCHAMGIPLVQGGLRDQPYIWLFEWAIISQVKTVFDAINSRGSQDPAQPPSGRF